jgi:flagellar biosynthesis/type III secretory pathway M-ring protein FliF/YscJ
MLKDDGTMGEVESRLDISIGSPWYRSWWAWLCYLLIAVVLFFGRKPAARLLKEWKERRPQRQEVEPQQENEEEKIEEAVLMDEDE